MNLIGQHFEILEFSDDNTLIEIAGRTCYASTDKIDENSADPFTKKLVDRKHLAMIEFGGATVKFFTSRSVSHELVRHRLCSFAQQSQRYVDLSNGNMDFIRPVNYDKWEPDARGQFELMLGRAERTYCRLRELGLPAEEAREVLPNATATEIIVKANFREWRHIFELRCSKQAHPQMRSLMTPCALDFYDRNLSVFRDVVGPLLFV